MFGINDSRGGSQDPVADNDSSAPEGQHAPVHGPLSNISPGTTIPDPQLNSVSAPADDGAPQFSAPTLQGPSFSPPGTTDATGQGHSGGDEPAEASGDLLGIKQQALAKLAPLMDHLEQTPEEKFKTTMMLIQASDNSQLLGEAYETANQIEDEKARASALLDIVNEINYFTHHGNANVVDENKTN